MRNGPGSRPAWHSSMLVQVRCSLGHEPVLSAFSTISLSLCPQSNDIADAALPSGGYAEAAEKAESHV